MNLTIPAAVQRAAREFGDATAIAEPGGPRLTYRDLYDRTRIVARALIADGVEPGDRIAVWSPNTHHWVLAALGALYAGATLVPVNTRFTGPEALDVIGRSRARGLIVAGPFLGADRLLTLVTAATEQAKSALPSSPRQNSSSQFVLPHLIVQVPVDTAEGPAGTTRHPPTTSSTPARSGQGAAAAIPLPSAVATPTEPNQLAHPPPDHQVLDWAQFERRAADVPGSAADDRAAAVGPDDVSDILFTSGTTGRSKGAMSAHRQALGVARAWADCAQLSQADRYLIVNPFFHSFGYKAGILACLLTGATMVPQLVFDPGESIRLIESQRITVFPGAPTIYTSILEHPDRADHDLSSLRLAVTGAAVVPVALVERMRNELSFGTVLTAYGLTEAVVVTMCRAADDPQTVARTSGRATAGFAIKIADPAGVSSPARPAHAASSAHEASPAHAANSAHAASPAQSASPARPGTHPDTSSPTGTAGPADTIASAVDCAIELEKPSLNAQSTAGRDAAGEVLLRGPNVMLGYLDDPAATAEAIDAEGWLHTGDIGRLDARGYLTITDRLKDMYICGGFNVYPAEVEQVLASHPSVAESVVIGVPDARLGEVGKAYVLPRVGQHPTADDLIAFCRIQLANYKVPRRVEFRTELPRNPAGKVLKRLLRQESS